MADTPPTAPTAPAGPPQPPHPAPQPQPHQKRRPPPPRPPARRPDDPPHRGPGAHGSGPGGARGPEDPAGRERAPVAVRRSNRFALLALAALLGAQLPLPWGVVAGTVFGVAALVVGLMAVIAAMDARLAAARVAVLWVSLAVVAVVVLLQLVRLVLYPSLVEVQDCRREAITIAAQAACDRQSGLPSR